MHNLLSSEFFGTLRPAAHAGGDTSATVVDHDPRFAVPWHRHERARICIILNGSIAENHGSRFDEFGKGHVLFWNEGVVHEDRFGRSGATTLQIELSHALFARVANHFPASPAPTRTERFEETVPRLLRELRSPDAVTPLLVEGAVHELVARASRLAGGTAMLSFAVDRAVVRIRETIGTRIRVDDIARIAQLSRRALGERFRAELGMPVTEFIRRERVTMAARLIESTQGPIADIACQCGFYDQAHLSREFRSHYGVAPRAWRMLRRAGSELAEEPACADVTTVAIATGR